MWNSFDIVNVLHQIKEIAKYKLFKQYGNKMKEEELVTTLAYLDYKGITVENINELFSIYTSLENKDKKDEHYEVKIFMNKKDNISNFLEDLKPNSESEKEFLKSVNCVNEFVNKLKILSKDDEDTLIKIFNPNITIPRKVNKKDFYIAWIILQQLDTHIVNTYRKEILEDLEKVFKLMKNIPSDKDINFFINYIKKIINKYSSKI